MIAATSAEPVTVDCADEDHEALRAVHRLAGSALCTLVGIDGSFSRRLGAQLAVDPDGRCAGSLADHCLERELASQARRAAGGPARMLRFGKGSPFLDFRLPCGSGLDILVDPAPDAQAVAEVVATLDRREVARLSLPVPPGQAMRERLYLPAPRLLAFGTGPEVGWLAGLAGIMGIDCLPCRPGAQLVLGTRPVHLPADRWTAVVLLFHDHEWEEAILDWALSTPAFYISAMGGHAVRAARQVALQHRSHPTEAIARVRSPAGLIGRARSPRVLALSVLAELVKEYECLRLAEQ